MSPVGSPVHCWCVCNDRELHTLLLLNRYASSEVSLTTGDSCFSLCLSHTCTVSFTHKFPHEGTTDRSRQVSSNSPFLSLPVNVCFTSLAGFCMLSLSLSLCHAHTHTQTHLHIRWCIWPTILEDNVSHLSPLFLHILTTAAVWSHSLAYPRHSTAIDL